MPSKPISNFDYIKYRIELLAILQEIQQIEQPKWEDLRKILSRHPRDGNKVFSKDHLVAAFYGLQKEGVTFLPNLLSKIQMKPTRSQSGVAVVTVLTKPFPCPGQCIFCPNDIRMPKSYLSDEPGAQRAERNHFDPYLQTYRRIKALYDIGHSVEKLEIIILGGTWSFYPENYQIWFIKRIFEAMNDFSLGKDQTKELEAKLRPHIPERFDKNFLSKKMDKATQIPTSLVDKKEKLNDNFDSISTPNLSQNQFLLNAEEITKLAASSYNQAVTKIIKSNSGNLNAHSESATWEELEEQQKLNEEVKCRCVGLVIETRPDKISPKEIIRIRRLGCTKAQIGFQSLQDDVLEKNKRGHDVEATRYAVKLLRQGGFKIHAHWMANLYGSNPEKDIDDFKKMFDDPDFCPDELKVYPCSLIETAELMDYYQKGLWKPYSYQELLQVLMQVIQATPQYCRLTRVIRDIPGTDIVVGNKVTNFREFAEKEMDKQGIKRQDIRSREIKNQLVAKDELHLDIICYKSPIGEEQFLQFVKENNQICGFLRLSLPDYQTHPFFPELNQAAVIREIHVYGQVVPIGSQKDGDAQHLGLGKELILKAKEIAASKGYKNLAVISAIGTRKYYKQRGFEQKGLYQVMDLTKN